MNVSEPGLDNKTILLWYIDYDDKSLTPFIDITPSQAAAFFFYLHVKVHAQLLPQNII